MTHMAKRYVATRLVPETTAKKKNANAVKKSG